MRARFYNVVDLVNQLDTEARDGRSGRLSDQMLRRDFVILDELGYLPFAKSGGQMLFHLISKLYQRVPFGSPPICRSANGPACSATRR